MKHFGVVAVLVALVAVSGLIYAMAKKPEIEGTWRYKVTVSIETPEGIKTGSAVRELHVKQINSILSSTGKTGKAKLSGEAVLIDLGERGVVFALMPTNVYRDFFDAFPTKPGGYTEAGINYYNDLYKNNIGKKVSIPEIIKYPRMVMFKDLNDPKSVTSVLYSDKRGSQNGKYTGKRMYEYEIKEDRFEELFGEAVKLKDVTIEITDEDIVWKIKKLLPWLGYINGRSLSGKNTSDPGRLGFLHGGHFIRAEF